MREFNMETKEHNAQAIMYSIICTHHRLYINNGNIPVFPGYIWNTWQNMMVQPPQVHSHGKNMTTLGKMDTSDLMMKIRWVTNISFQWPNWPVEHTQLIKKNPQNLFVSDIYIANAKYHWCCANLQRNWDSYQQQRRDTLIKTVVRSAHTTCHLSSSHVLQTYIGSRVWHKITIIAK